MNDRDMFTKTAVEPQMPLAGSNVASVAASVASNGIQFNNFNQDDFGLVYEELSQKLETLIHMFGQHPLLQNQAQCLVSILEHVMVVRRTREQSQQQNLLKKAVDNMMEGLVSIPECTDQVKLYRDVHLRILKILQDNRNFGSIWTNKQIARYMIEAPDSYRYNVEAADVLISAGLVQIQQYDACIANLIESGNFTAAGFATKLLQLYFLDERSSGLVQDGDFQLTITILERLAQHNNGPEPLLNLLEMLRNQQDQSVHLSDRAIHGPTAYIHSGIAQVKNSGDGDEPAGFLERSEYLLKDWIQVFQYSQGINRDPIKAFSAFVNKMNIYGMLKGEILNEFI
jgi:CCR4-NOT transcription complex subunit 1